MTQLATIASPNKILTEAAEAWVSRWTYTPFLRDGKPVEVETTILVDFLKGRAKFPEYDVFSLLHYDE